MRAPVTAKYNSYLSPDGFSTPSITCDVMTLVSGTNKDGTWSTTCTVPQGKASGNYYFSSSTFEDANGIGSNCSSNVSSGIYACHSTGTKLLLAVDNGQESDAPVLSDLSLSVSSVDVSSESKFVDKLKAGDKIVVEGHMLRNISVFGETATLVEDNYVLAKL